MKTVAMKYDNYGRMKYHPEFHTNQRTPWSTTDERYLIENYERTGATAMSLALGRTVTTVVNKAWNLRQKGLMAPTLRGKSNKKSKNAPGGKSC